MGARGQLLVATKYAWSVLTAPVHELSRASRMWGPLRRRRSPLAGLRGSR